MKKFLIVSPDYCEISGGVVALHKLCDILNKFGYSAFLYPYVSCRENSPAGRWKSLLGGMFDDLRIIRNRISKNYKVNPHYETPVIYSINLSMCQDQWIVVYPEITYGNPLSAQNVIRWFLHHPGFHSGKVSYAKGELYFRFNEAMHNFSLDGSYTSANFLKVIHYPVEFYNNNNLSTERKGTAYCIRKGKGKKLIHDLEDSILIDGKSHEEVADILKTVKRFISYDTYTAYSIFAILCGCESVVIPDEGVSEEAWYPNIEDRYGIAYGFEKIKWANDTVDLQMKRINSEHEKSILSVKTFALEAQKFFDYHDAQPEFYS